MLTIAGGLAADCSRATSTETRFAADTGAVHFLLRGITGRRSDPHH